MYAVHVSETFLSSYIGSKDSALHCRPQCGPHTRNLVCLKCSISILKFDMRNFNMHGSYDKMWLYKVVKLLSRYLAHNKCLINNGFNYCCCDSDAGGGGSSSSIIMLGFIAFYLCTFFPYLYAILIHSVIYSLVIFFSLLYSTCFIFILKKKT